MTIFHEIYGAYYRITARLLRRGRVTRQDIADVTAQEGFRDSMLFLPQKLKKRNQHRNESLPTWTTPLSLFLTRTTFLQIR